jgi:hypothetical protein
MSVKARGTRAAPFTSSLLAVVLVAGCGVAEPDYLVEFEAAPDLHFNDGDLALHFGNALVDVWAGGQLVFADGEVVIAAGAPTEITATFHDAATKMVRGLGDYVLTMTPADTVLLRFTPNSTIEGRFRTFRGTLTRIAAGTTTVSVSLHNTVRDLEDFGPFEVPVTVK